MLCRLSNIRPGQECTGGRTCPIGKQKEMHNSKCTIVNAQCIMKDDKAKHVHGKRHVHTENMYTIEGQWETMGEKFQEVQPSTHEV